MNDQELLECLNSGHDLDLEKAFLYFDKTMRVNFKYWSYLNYWYKFIDDSAISEVYQESLIVLYSRVKNQGTSNIKVKLHTYFYGIAKRKWKEYFRKLKFNEELRDIFVFIDQTEENKEKEIILTNIEKYLEKLPEQCQAILKLTFHQDMDCQEISEIFPQWTVNNCRQKRFQCIKKMREELGRYPQN